MNPELAALQQVIQDVHHLMTVLADPQDTNVVAQCLKALTGIQQKMMTQQQAGGNPQQAMLAQLAGGGGGLGGR